MRTRTCDIAIIGSGFAGSLMAMIARRLGYTVILLERGKHPRFVIGESSTPLTNLLLEELALRYHLDPVLPMAKWGTWQRALPHLSCGLKRGFTFYHHEWNQPFHAWPDRRNQLLIAASPRDEIADTHWFRPDFDAFLVQEAQRLGADFIDEVALNLFQEDYAGNQIEGMRGGEPLRVQARFVIDASGPRGFLHRQLGLGEQPFADFPPTEALFSHFHSVQRLDALGVIPTAQETPYPVDDAAVHHLFTGGWIWVLRFNNGVTSAGVAATSSLANELRFVEGASAWQRLLQRLPTVREQFSASTAIRPFQHSSRLSFRSAKVVGTNWALLPSAAGFVDPLLSTGFPLTLLGVSRLANILERRLQPSALDTALAEYEQRTLAELDATADLISGLYACLTVPRLFNALSLLYFAAASYSETVRRLNRPQLAASFLLRDHPSFGPAVRDLCRNVRWLAGLQPVPESDLSAFEEAVRRTIEPFNVAGLADPKRGNWYPVNTDDLYKSAGKLGASEAEISTLLARCGLR